MSAGVVVESETAGPFFSLCLRMLCSTWACSLSTRSLAVRLPRVVYDPRNSITVPWSQSRPCLLPLEGGPRSLSAWKVRRMISCLRQSGILRCAPSRGRGQASAAARRSSTTLATPGGGENSAAADDAGADFLGPPPPPPLPPAAAPPPPGEAELLLGFLKGLAPSPSSSSSSSSPSMREPLAARGLRGEEGVTPRPSLAPPPPPPAAAEEGTAPPPLAATPAATAAAARESAGAFPEAVAAAEVVLRERPPPASSSSSSSSCSSSSSSSPATSTRPWQI